MISIAPLSSRERRSRTATFITGLALLAAALSDRQLPVAITAASIGVLLTWGRLARTFAACVYLDQRRYSPGLTLVGTLGFLVVANATLLRALDRADPKLDSWICGFAAISLFALLEIRRSHPLDPERGSGWNVASCGPAALGFAAAVGVVSTLRGFDAIETPLEAAPLLLACIAGFVVADPDRLDRRKKRFDETLVEELRSLGVEVQQRSDAAGLARTRRIVVDRSRSIGGGAPEVVRVDPLIEGKTEEDVLRLAAAAEFGVQHPLRDAIFDRRDRDAGTVPAVKGTQLHPSEGVVATLRGREIACGNARLMRRLEIDADSLEPALQECRSRGYSGLFVAVDRNLYGQIFVSETIRDDAVRGADLLQKLGVSLVIMTGYQPEAVKAACSALGPIDVRARNSEAGDVESDAKTAWLSRETPVVRARSRFVGQATTPRFRRPDLSVVAQAIATARTSRNERRRAIAFGAGL
ncbi:MAG: hypothetical protein AAF517_15220, partial [Planctomycetota bacterium]